MLTQYVYILCEIVKSKLTWGVTDLFIYITDITSFIFPELPDNGYANNWSISMDKCKKSHPPSYLFGNVDLTNPHLTCTLSNPQSLIVWIGVARQIYASIDQGICEIPSTTQL